MDDNGKIRATAVEGAEISLAGEAIINASTDKSITVEIAASDRLFSISKMANIGVFEYAKISQNNMKIDGKIQVTTRQSTNPEKLGQMDTFFDKIIGTSITHEIVESYIAGQMVQERGVSSGNGNTLNSVYEEAHETASKIAPAAGSITPMINDAGEVIRFDIIKNQKRQTLWELP